MAPLPTGSGASRLHQLVQDGARIPGRYARWPEGERSAAGEHRLALVERGGVALVEEPDRDLLVPFAGAVERGVEVGRIVTEVLELLRPLLEEVVGVVLVVGHA